MKCWRREKVNDMSDKAFITPNVIKWARESAKMSSEIAASKMGIKLEKLLEWEEGKDQPTIKQAEKLAKIYKRPFAVFFLTNPPRDFQVLQDFRRPTSKPLSTASIFIIREIQEKQSWMKELCEEKKEPKLSFVGKFSLNDNPEIIAKDILNTLEIEPMNYSKNNPILEWILKAEKKGIFISRTSLIHSRLKLDSDEIQGFSIADAYAPFVFVNSEDWDAPQLFTLVHELAHIWIAQSGISNEIEVEVSQKDALHPVEIFCNEIAANALMPKELMKKNGVRVFNSFDELYKTSRNFGVSAFAFLYRAYKLEIISLEKYRALKKQAEKAFKEFEQKELMKKEKQKEQKGGPNPYLMRLNKNSRLFTQIVLDSFRNGDIEPTEASNLLSTQVNKFIKLEELIYR